MKPDELDRAISLRKLKLGRKNRRPIQCVSCCGLASQGEARKLFIEGHYRGYFCLDCVNGVTRRRAPLASPLRKG